MCVGLCELCGVLGVFEVCMWGLCKLCISVSDERMQAVYFRLCELCDRLCELCVLNLRLCELFILACDEAM